MSATISATGTWSQLTNKPTNEGGGTHHENQGGSNNADQGWKDSLADGGGSVSEIEQFVGLFAEAHGLDGFSSRVAIRDILDASIHNPIDGSERTVGAVGP